MNNITEGREVENNSFIKPVTPHLTNQSRKGGGSNKPRRRAISVVSISDQGGCSVKLAYTDSRASLASDDGLTVGDGLINCADGPPTSVQLNDALSNLAQNNNNNYSAKEIGSGGGGCDSRARSRHASARSSMFKVALGLEWNDFTQKFGKRNLGHRIDFSSRIAHSAGSSVTHCNPWTYLLNLFPFITWIQQYDIKNFLLPDIIVGFTVAVLHLPQGMAYGLLAGVNPINGLYVSFFPVIIYSFMATSKHNSIGTSALVSIMLKNALEKLPAIDDGALYHQANATAYANRLEDGQVISSIQVVNQLHVEALASLCLLTGVIMLVMGFLHLGSLSLILSDQLVSAFVCGSAVHVATSQFENFFGIRFQLAPEHSGGLFQLGWKWIALFKHLPEIHPPTIIVSLVSIVVLVILKELVEPRLKRVPSLKAIPFPSDLIVIILATAISYAFLFGPSYKMKIMGVIPTGLPAPVVPRMDLVNYFWTDAIAIGIVSFTVCASLGKIYAKEHHYRVIPNQELIAMGAANVFSSFFACFACSSSLSRSAIQSIAGGKTSVASLVSCLILLVVLLFLAPLLYHLPKCILAVVTLVALKSLLLQTKDFFTYWKLSRLEAITWAVTFFSVVFGDIDYGLLIGVIFSTFIVMIRFIIPSSTLLGQLPGTEIYVDLLHFKKAKEVQGVKIYQYSCSLFYMNRDHFKDSFYNRTLGLSSDDVLELVNCSIAAAAADSDKTNRKSFLDEKNNHNTPSTPAAAAAPRIKFQGRLSNQVSTQISDHVASVNDEGIDVKNSTIIFPKRENNSDQLFGPRSTRGINVVTHDPQVVVAAAPSAIACDAIDFPVHSIVIDCSTISYIDSSGVETIHDIIKSLKSLNIKCYLASAPTQVLIMFERKKLLENLDPTSSGIFASVHDAVVHSSSSLQRPNNYKNNKSTTTYAPAGSNHHLVKL